MAWGAPSHISDADTALVHAQGVPVRVIKVRKHGLQGKPRVRLSDLGVRDAALRLSGGVNASGTLTAHALYPNSGARSLAGSSTEGVNLGSCRTTLRKSQTYPE